MNPAFQISIVGNFLASQDCPIQDFLWHDVVSSLPEIGDVLKICDEMFQVEKISLNDLPLDDDDKERYIIDVRSYKGSIEPSLIFCDISSVWRHEACRPHDLVNLPT